ncbi:MAG: Hsp20/alpha crystallin family protein [Bacteroidales bacterium]
MDEFFGRDLLDNIFPDQTGVSMPAVNVIDAADEFRIEVAAPGLDKNDFKVDLDNRMLTISCEKEQKKEENGGDRFMRREFSYTSFRRSFSLPEGVDTDKVKAHHKNGVLNIHIPKKEEAKQKPPKQISIS